MTHLLRFACLLVIIALPPAGPAHGDEGTGEPFELVRSLRALQDHIARGSTSAHANLRTFLAQMAEQFATVEPAKWQERKNARAVITFVLSGGDPGVLRKLVGSGVRLPIDDQLVKGILAFGEGRSADAAELLGGINARSLEPSIAGHVALVQAELVARKDPAKAIVHLEDARLLAPGTLVEEAGLRRQILLLAAAGDFARWEALSGQYLRRFPNSVYAGGFRRQFAVDIVSQKIADDPDRQPQLEALLAGVGSTDRRDVYLSIAKEALIRGKVEMTRFAAANAGGLAEKGSIESARSGVYQGAALVVTDELERGLSILEGIEKAELPEHDAELREAAVAVAAAVRYLPEPGAAGSGPPPVAAGVGGERRKEATVTAEVVERAHKAMAQVDDILKGANK